MSKNLQLQELRHAFVDLADERMGSKVIYYTDEFFAPVENLLKPKEPVSIPDKFTARGKWMDGWESRRRRGGGHDYCIVQFGISGIIKAVDVDTRHFTGNYPDRVALEVCNSTTPPDTTTHWTTLIPATHLQGDAHNLFAVDDADIRTHARLNIYPDGGVARLRIYGNAYRDWSGIDNKQFLDLVGVENGGRTLACNDEHFGNMGNIIMPGRALNMGDGWETRRRRDGGHDWLILQLGHAGIIDTVNVDTAFFRGNYPDRVSLDALYRPGFGKDTPPLEGPARHDAPGRNPDALLNNGATWQPLLAEQKLRPDREHLFKKELQDVGPVSHIRVNIHPDGGLSRLRAYGYKYTE